MIYTITCNPSLDYIMQVPSFTLGETNRSKKEEIFVGGKGFNVSTILHRLHLPTCAYGFIAGFSGQEIKRLLAQRGFVYRLIEVNEGFSRINVKMKGEKETEINGNGPMITENDLRLFMYSFNHFKMMIQSFYLVVFQAAYKVIYMNKFYLF